MDDSPALAVDGDTEGTACTDHWHAAMDDSFKPMWAVFQESGIFISTCRHGFIWWIADMVESGEL
jgi:hypothetical protein